MNNSLFWKTIENISNYKYIKVLKSQKKYDKYLRTPNFKDEYSFSKMLFAVEVEENQF